MGRTALHTAALEGHKEVIEILLSNGAHKDATDKVSLFVCDCCYTAIMCLYIYTKCVVVYCHHFIDSI